MLGPGAFGPCLGRGLDLGHCRSQPDDPPSVRSAWSCSGRCHPLPDRATSPSPHLSPFSAPPTRQGALALSGDMSVVTDQGPGATGIQCVVARMLLSTQNASAELSTSRQWSCRHPHPDTRWARSSPCPRRRPADPRRPHAGPPLRGCGLSGPRAHAPQAGL